MYKVIRAFCDSKDGNRLYNVGDTFPVDGVKVSKERTKSLLDGSNKNGNVYLEEITGPKDHADGKTNGDTDD